MSILFSVQRFQLKIIKKQDKYYIVPLTICLIKIVVYKRSTLINMTLWVQMNINDTISVPMKNWFSEDRWNKKLNIINHLL
jgi:hypothetical protein